MVGTAAHPGPYDPLENARPDEIIFTLAARDPDAPPTIGFWTHLRRNRAIKLWGHSTRKRDKALLDAELKQCAEADEVAAAMVEWRQGLGEPAVLEGDGRATYSDVKKTAEQVAEADAAKKLEAMIRHLREAAYHICEAKDGLDLLGLLSGNHSEKLLWNLDFINALADEVTPKRTNVVESDDGDA